MVSVDVMDVPALLVGRSLNGPAAERLDDDDRTKSGLAWRESRSQKREDCVVRMECRNGERDFRQVFDGVAQGQAPRAPLK